ncbi:MAG: glutathione S-transferase family protein [Pseudomonadota bacterium]
MKLYDVKPAPNPRRVRIFLAEKGLEIPLVPVDMMALEQRSPAFRQKNPSGKVPVLELDDGTCIGESIAICRCLEAMHPEPNLFGESPAELGRIEMFTRIIELELMSQVGAAWVNGPIVAQMAPGRFTQIPEAKTLGEKNARSFYKRLNGELETRDYIAGDRFTIADIAAVTTIDFAGERVALKPDSDLTALWRWHARIASRPSYDA